MEPTENIKERIRRIISKKGLSPSKFADTIGVQRSGISHILSGRNKPSLELLNKILINFPDINAGWLITGNGDAFGEIDKKGTLPADELFTGNEPGKKKTEVEMNVNREEDPPEYSIRRKNTGQESPGKDSFFKEEKKIEKIVVFFSDRTFREYSSE